VTSPKRHHYLPQFYIDAFCRSGKIWVYDRQKDQFRQQTPPNTAVIGHYYSIAAPDGEKDTELESVLAQVESEAKPIIAKVSDGRRISDQEKANLAYFIAWLYARVPEFQATYEDLSEELYKKILRQAFATVEETQRLVESHPALKDHPITISAKRLHEFVQGGDYEIKTHRNLSLMMSIETAQDLWNYFVQMNWVFCRAEAGSHYITTDTPVCLIPPVVKPGPAWMGTGLLTPGAAKLVPLTSNTALLMGDRGTRMVHRATEAWRVRDGNLALAVRCHRYLLGPDEAELRDLVSTTGIAGTEPPPRIRMV